MRELLHVGQVEGAGVDGVLGRDHHPLHEVGHRSGVAPGVDIDGRVVLEQHSIAILGEAPVVLRHAVLGDQEWRTRDEAPTGLEDATGLLDSYPGSCDMLQDLVEDDEIELVGGVGGEVLHVDGGSV